MRLIVGDLELNCALVAIVDLAQYGKFKLKRSRELLGEIPDL